MGYWEVHLTWLDSNQRSYIWIFGWTLREDVRLASPLQIFPEGGGTSVHRLSLSSQQGI